MATRPIFLPMLHTQSCVREQNIEFTWYPGMTKSQYQKSIQDLHAQARLMLKVNRILEISSKSEEQLGVALSAFNLFFITKKNQNKLTVETAFQGSKVFEKGGPYTDLYGVDSKKAKTDPRLKNSGKLHSFKFFGQDFHLEPKTYFYDWVYINALNQNKELSKQLLNYGAFTDIVFNPKKSINCQARSAALFVSLVNQNKLEDSLVSAKCFLEILKDCYWNPLKSSV